MFFSDWPKPTYAARLNIEVDEFQYDFIACYNLDIINLVTHGSCVSKWGQTVYEVVYIGAFIYLGILTYAISSKDFRGSRQSVYVIG